MGDENPIRTLGDYSKPSHEGYRNTIDLPVGNNVDPNQHLKDFLKLVYSLDLDGSINTWEDLTTRFLAQFFPPGRAAKLRNDILMFQQHHGESLSKAWTHFNDLLQIFPHHGLDLGLQIQIFYDHVDDTNQKGIDYAAGRRLRKLRPNEAWLLSRGWLNMRTKAGMTPSSQMKKLLGIMKQKFDTLMKDAISLMGKRKSVFQLTANEMYRPPSKPSRQEEFEHIVMNFIFDQ
ncbi:zinc finger, CCHC-type containing protein [Tanacetum coccineum]